MCLPGHRCNAAFSPVLHIAHFLPSSPDASPAHLDPASRPLTPPEHRGDHGTTLRIFPLSWSQQPRRAAHVPRCCVAAHTKGLSWYQLLYLDPKSSFLFIFIIVSSLKTNAMDVGLALYIKNAPMIFSMYRLNVLTQTSETCSVPKF